MERSEGSRFRRLNPALTAAAASLRNVLDLLLPLACVVCDQLLRNSDSGLVCGHCWSRARLLPHPRCERCGHPVTRYSCRWCALLPPYIRAARSWCWVAGGADAGLGIVHALKYSGWKRVAEAMATRMSQLSWPPDVMEERTALVPIPLSRIRERERGYNQSALLASHLARRWDLPVWGDVVQRTRATHTQTELTPGERLSNVAGAFDTTLTGRDRLRGSHIILLDDVVTTGATLGACADALFAAGARTLSYLTFGRAPASGDRL